MPTFEPTWLDPADVREWLQANSLPTSDVVGLDRVCAMSEKHVERCRPDMWAYDDLDPDEVAYAPDAEVYHAAVMYAARLCRRRNNPTGVESFGDAGLVFTPRYDADIDKALHTGAYMLPGVG